MSAKTSQAQPKVAVVIPLHRDNARFRHCLHRTISLSYEPLEIIVVTDEIEIDLPKPVTHVKTGSATSTPPGIKRDAAFQESDADVFAFLDDDAYPHPDWIHSAVRHLTQDLSLAGLGGPGLTPPDSSLWERLSGATYESRFGSGPIRYRFLPLGPRPVEDLPAYNFFVRRDPLRKIGGWSSTFYGGEDTKVCLELVRHGYRLRYEPDIVVFHYRRKAFRMHMKQVRNVGVHRGFFMKRLPETSRRPTYMASPAAVSLALATLATMVLVPSVRLPLLSVTALGYLLVALANLKRHDWRVAFLLPLSLLLHHVAYTSGMLKGLLLKELDT